MEFKDYVMMFLGLLLPIIWTAITAVNPDFPLAQNMFVELFMYLAAALFGLKTAKAIIVRQLDKLGLSYSVFMKAKKLEVRS